MDSTTTPNNIIDKLRAQWSLYNNSTTVQTNTKQRRQHKQKEHQEKQLIQKRDFHYKYHHCNEPIFYSQYWFDDFQNRYIPVSSYTHRPHKCYQKEEEKKQGLMNGTYLTPF